jgi:hypothetical protein
MELNTLITLNLRNLKKGDDYSYIRMSYKKKEKINGINYFIFSKGNYFYYFKNKKNPKINNIKECNEVDLILNSENDRPAIISIKDNHREWYKNGLRHRDNDLPAFSSPECQEWYFNGLIHREGFKPAVINLRESYVDIKDDYLINNFYKYSVPINEEYLGRYEEQINHNETRTTITNSLGTTLVLKNGLYHSDNDKPAITTSQSEYWFNKGALHRKGKPACSTVRKTMYGQHQPFSQWYKNGSLLSEEDIENEKLADKINQF